MGQKLTSLAAYKYLSFLSRTDLNNTMYRACYRSMACHATVECKIRFYIREGYILIITEVVSIVISRIVLKYGGDGFDAQLALLSCDRPSRDVRYVVVMHLVG